MRKKPFFLLLLACVCLSVSARGGDKMVQYFLATLNGANATPPASRVGIARLNAQRKEVWQAWQAANALLNEPSLPPLDSISYAPRGKWELPDSLEPHAAMPFYFGSKGDRPEKGYPLFLYLHGSGPKEMEWQNGLAFALQFADAPSLYFVPQIPNEGKWYRWYQRSKQFAWERLLRQAMLRCDVDPDRIYFFGISEGGYGSQRLASFYADYLAAAGPMAGGEPLKNAPAENIMHTPFTLRTGAEDKMFYRDKLTGYTKSALDSLARLFPGNFIHRVELIPGCGHHIDYSQTTPWLSKFTRNPWPKSFIWEDYEMDSLHRGGFYNILVKERPDETLRTRYEMKISGNEVTVDVRNVRYETVETDTIYGIELKFQRTYETACAGSFTLFLDEHLVDLENPVKVTVNGRAVFEGKLRLNVKNMLRAVSAFYDPRRIFPAAVEVDLKNKR